MSFFLWFNKDCPQTKKTFTCMQFTFLPLRPLRSPIIEDVFFNNQELLDLDQIGLPDVLSPSILRLITENLHQSHHGTMVVCTVCDQICRKSKTTLFTVDDLPSNFF
jgi:hypothetical protein